MLYFFADHTPFLTPNWQQCQSSLKSNINEWKRDLYLHAQQLCTLTSPSPSHHRRVTDRGRLLQCWRSCNCQSARSAPSTTPEHNAELCSSVFSPLTHIAYSDNCFLCQTSINITTDIAPSACCLGLLPAAWATQQHSVFEEHVMFVRLFEWCLTTLSSQTGYIVP